MPGSGTLGRVVVLGASNVRRGFPRLLAALRGVHDAPLDLLVAAGHGRSYGMGSRVLGRTLPGILGSGIWTALRERPARPTVALVTDVGNDILYGAPPSIIVGWVGEAVRRLRESAHGVALAGLPLAGIDALGSARYLAVRHLLFPRCRVTLADARSAAHDIDAALREVARSHGAAFVEPDASWYGLDPIHVRRRAQPAAWAAVLAPLGGSTAAAAPRSSLGESLALRGLRPERRWLLGVEQVTAQPAGTLADGSRVSLY